ncbi:hypothetical protein POM88_051246 [Heracleum sosnowskyi]|uniref:FHA domain-containing protein n=1 Tax=Heracleum sosnowskyi TaxID=360622 RepID=A0AAD8M139_9APIA|nr:hypothetical protein POM88_051246 [Heracleum sosnowskyi]
MSSHGALTFLYGRHLKHYIEKPEVLLGRSADDVDVDIDLRKEGQANKISRRQIKGMSFVFEINHKYVRRYLDTSKYEWSRGHETWELLKGASLSRDILISPLN